MAILFSAFPFSPARGGHGIFSGGGGLGIFHHQKRPISEYWGWQTLPPHASGIFCSSHFFLKNHFQNGPNKKSGWGEFQENTFTPPKFNMEPENDGF